MTGDQYAYQRPGTPEFTEWLAGALRMAISEGEAYPGSTVEVAEGGRVRFVFGDTGRAFYLAAAADLSVLGPAGDSVITGTPDEINAELTRRGLPTRIVVHGDTVQVGCRPEIT